MATNELDLTDSKILTILQKDANVSIKEIAYQTHKSIATVHERIRRLKEQGYILRTVAILNRKKINKSLIAFSQVILSGHSDKILSDFTNEVVKFPEVMECFQMTGRSDFLLRIVTNDMEEYSQFYNHKLTKLPNVNTVQSAFVMSENKSDTAYPI